ncbi:winged helix-turn-helix domain-containing protein [Nitrosomonas communis]|nr:winged helix-turn-helix domain-containing protein [Nitrosomonas communis]
MDKRLGKRVALSTIYRILARHGWCKLVPDITHPQGNPALLEDWKKLKSG